jgi:hypothetical protein
VPHINIELSFFFSKFFMYWFERERETMLMKARDRNGSRGHSANHISWLMEARLVKQRGKSLTFFVESEMTKLRFIREVREHQDYHEEKRQLIADSAVKRIETLFSSLTHFNGNLKFNSDKAESHFKF